METILYVLTVDFWLLFSIGIGSSIIGSMFGAAGLVTIPAMLIVGIPIHLSIAANKFATGLSAFTNVMTFYRRKSLDLKMTAKQIITGIAGGVCGAFFATQLSEHTMNIIASILLVFSFFIVVISRKYMDEMTPSRQPKSTKLVAPFFISIYDGGFGPGSATMSITYYLHRSYGYQKAAEFSRVIIFASCFGGFLWFYIQGLVRWDIAIPVTLGAIIGSHIGILLLPKLNMKWVRLILPLIFLILIAQVFIELFF